MNGIDYASKLTLLEVTSSEQGFQQSMFSASPKSGYYYYQLKFKYDIFMFECAVSVKEDGEVTDWFVPFEFEYNNNSSHYFRFPSSNGGILCCDLDFLFALEDILVNEIEARFPGKLLR